MNSTTGAFFEKNRKCSYVKRNKIPCDKCVSIKDTDNDWKFCSIHIYKNPQEKKLKMYERQLEMKRKEEEERAEIQKMLEEKIIQRVEERVKDYESKVEAMEKANKELELLREKLKTIKSILHSVGVEIEPDD
jgi:hypothetical protein